MTISKNLIAIAITALAGGSVFAQNTVNSQAEVQSESPQPRPKDPHPDELITNSIQVQAMARGSSSRSVRKVLL